MRVFSLRFATFSEPPELRCNTGTRQLHQGQGNVRPKSIDVDTVTRIVERYVVSIDIFTG
jgi:hypothetical protein